MNRKKTNEHNSEASIFTIDDAVAQINAFLKEQGVPKELCTGEPSEDENSIQWLASSEALGVRIEISIAGLKSETPCFLINSYIAALPELGILPFYRRCLELNDELYEGNLNADGKYIALTTRRSFPFLTPAEMDYKLLLMFKEAPLFAKKLREEFNLPAQPPD